MNKKVTVYQEIKGDLIKLAKEGKFDVIAHGCNCFNTMGAGIAPKMAEAFGCDKYHLEDKRFQADVNKLGQINYFVGYSDFEEEPGIKKQLTVVNAYTQFSIGRNQLNNSDIALDYTALRLCLRKMNWVFAGKHIGLPQIGCGLAGGNWERVKNIIFEELCNCDVTVVIFE